MHGRRAHRLGRRDWQQVVDAAVLVPHGVLRLEVHGRRAQHPARRDRGVLVVLLPVGSDFGLQRRLQATRAALGAQPRRPLVRAVPRPQRVLQQGPTVPACQPHHHGNLSHQLALLAPRVGHRALRLPSPRAEKRPEGLKSAPPRGRGRRAPRARARGGDVDRVHDDQVRRDHGRGDGHHARWRVVARARVQVGGRRPGGLRQGEGLVLVGRGWQQVHRLRRLVGPRDLRRGARRGERRAR
mmetsp:Transcript_8998/g.36737  ORF Transcript_8998/g.36737 Transcript_8998/m.36737 type:complete len:241 (+) Transcript_8998:1844-2566(+)